MKRIAIVVLAVLLLATVGATAAVAAPSGPSAARHFDVTSGPVSGKLNIDTAAQTFVFNGKGCAPGTTYYLYTSLATAPLGSGVADANGNLHIEGTCTATTAQLDTATVTLTTTPPGPTLLASPDHPTSGQTVLFTATFPGVTPALVTLYLDSENDVHYSPPLVLGYMQAPSSSPGTYTLSTAFWGSSGDVKTMHAEAVATGQTISTSEVTITIA